MANHDATGQGSVRAVERALDILLAFRPQDSAVTVGELLDRIDLSRPTLYRLLHTLQAKQFLTSSGNPKQFRLGPAVAQLANAWSATLDITAVAEPTMRRLWDKTSETVALFVREATSRVCVAEMPSGQGLSFRCGIGYRQSLARGAGGKAILAFLSENERGGLQNEARKQKRELAEIRERGFAVSNSELIQGVVAVSAPVFGGSGGVVGCLSVFGPSVRLSESQILSFGRLLTREAAEISQLLGKGRH